MANLPRDEATRASFEGEMARNYHLRTGGCNITLAQHLIKLLSPYVPAPDGSAPQTLRILDNACGPLVLTTECLKSPAVTSFATAHPESKLHFSAVDISESFITANRALIASNPLYGDQSNGAIKVETEEMDSASLTLPSDTFDLSFTSLAIFALPSPVAGAREIYRTLKPGGAAALTTWKHVGSLPLLRVVEAEVRPGKEPTRFPMLEAWQMPGKLESVLREAGFGDVVEGEVVVYAWWRNGAEMARWICETMRMLCADWTPEEKGAMEEGMEKAIGETTELVERDGDRVGARMVAYTAVARK